MINCQDIDLIQYIEHHEITPEVRDHINHCDACKQAIAGLRRTIHALTPYFQAAYTRDCPHLEHITDQMLAAGTLSDPALAQHVQTCPVCSHAYLLLADFDQTFKDPLISSAPPLPESLRKTIRSKQVASRTTHALEKLLDKKSKTKEWIQGVVERALNGAQPQAAPAAREDLTDGQDEVEKKQKPPRKPNGKTDDPQSQK